MLQKNEARESAGSGPDRGAGTIFLSRGSGPHRAARGLSILGAGKSASPGAGPGAAAPLGLWSSPYWSLGEPRGVWEAQQTAAGTKACSQEGQNVPEGKDQMPGSSVAGSEPSGVSRPAGGRRRRPEEAVGCQDHRHKAKGGHVDTWKEMNRSKLGRANHQVNPSETFKTEQGEFFPEKGRNNPDVREPCACCRLTTATTARDSQSGPAQSHPGGRHGAQLLGRACECRTLLGILTL